VTEDVLLDEIMISALLVGNASRRAECVEDFSSELLRWCRGVGKDLGYTPARWRPDSDGDTRSGSRNMVAMRNPTEPPAFVEKLRPSNEDYLAMLSRLLDIVSAVLTDMRRRTAGPDSRHYED
jgi:hypothetical protein